MSNRKATAFASARFLRTPSSRPSRTPVRPRPPHHMYSWAWYHLSIALNPQHCPCSIMGRAALRHHQRDDQPCMISPAARRAPGERARGREGERARGREGERPADLSASRWTKWTKWTKWRPCWVGHMVAVARGRADTGESSANGLGTHSFEGSVRLTVALPMENPYCSCELTPWSGSTIPMENPYCS